MMILTWYFTSVTHPLSLQSIESGNFLLEFDLKVTFLCHGLGTLRELINNFTSSLVYKAKIKINIISFHLYPAFQYPSNYNSEHI